MIKSNLKEKVLISLALLISILAVHGSPASATTYGTAHYGGCLYGTGGDTCVSITNNGFFLVLNVTPNTSGSCTIQSDQVSVLTYDTNGYTLTLSDQTTNTNLVDRSGDNIPRTSGTYASPAAMTDAWGYRIDSSTLGGFGAGPTTAVNPPGAHSTVIFAGIKASNVTADTIASTSTFSSSPVSTTVWYGVCLDYALAIPAGSYSTTVLYTATAN